MIHTNPRYLTSPPTTTQPATSVFDFPWPPSSPRAVDLDPWAKLNPTNDQIMAGQPNPPPYCTTPRKYGFHTAFLRKTILNGFRFHKP